jgi:hypothetical protein
MQASPPCGESLASRNDRGDVAHGPPCYAAPPPQPGASYESRMKVPRPLQPLIEDGIIDSVVRRLRSGKEASVFIVECRGELRCAKVYKDADHRGFHRLAEYQEGRKVRGSRDARALRNSGRHGRELQEAQWKNAEVEALYTLDRAGVRVPKPYGVFDGVLLMELVADQQGHPAPRLERPGDLARAGAPLAQVSADLAGGADARRRPHPRRPVGVQRARGCRSARSSSTCPRRSMPRATTMHSACWSATSITCARPSARSAPELLDTHYAHEIWALYGAGLN